jgi:hypothetical protein
MMIKKMLVGTAVAAVLGTFVFGRDVFSYVTTWGSSMREAVKSEVPLDFEMDRAREMVEDLVPDIRSCMTVIAEQQVDIDHLDKEIGRKEQALDEQKTMILTLRQDLSSGNSTFVYASRRYSTNDVKDDLARRFSRFKMAEETLERDRQILAARKKSVLANQNKLDAMMKSKQELEVQIVQLDARLKTVQAAESVTALEIDDSQLARAKKLIAGLNRQLHVKEKLLDAEGKFTNLIPVDLESQESTDITSEIDNYFEVAPGTDDSGQREIAPAA